VTRKIQIILYGIMFLMAVLIGRLFQLQVLRGGQFQEKSNYNQIREVVIPAPRGLILDRRGREMVRNRPSFAAAILPAEVEDPALLARRLAPILGMTTQQVEDIITRHVNSPFELVPIKDGLDPHTLARLAEKRSRLPGVFISVLPSRHYWKGMAAHLLGYVGEISEQELADLKAQGYRERSTIGKAGLERQYDRQLRGSEGVRRIQVDVAGRVIRTLEETAPVPGDTLSLTIDRQVQETAETALADALYRIGARNGQSCAGAVVALDPDSGAVLAMVSKPAYDPNLFARGISGREYRKLMDNPLYPMLDRVSGASFPCGSTFKMITASAALQEGVCQPTSGFYCPGVLYVGEQPFNCFVRSGHGGISFTDAIAHSCDVVFYRLGQGLRIDRLDDYAGRYGIGRKTGIDLPDEDPGLLPDPAWKERMVHEEWYPGDTINLSIGQGFLGVTPLQLALVTATVANGGTVWRPFLVGQMTDAQGGVTARTSPHPTGNVGINPEYLEAVRRGMRGAVAYGTATAAALPDLVVAGKTGTAENFPSPSNPYGRNHAWFTCFAPYDHPRIVVTVFLEASGGFGGQWAAPIAREVMAAFFREEKQWEQEQRQQAGPPPAGSEPAGSGAAESGPVAPPQAGSGNNLFPNGASEPPGTEAGDFRD